MIPCITLSPIARLIASPIQYRPAVSRAVPRVVCPPAGPGGAMPAGCLAGRRLVRSRAGFGLNEVIGIAAGIIIAVVIVIPGLQVFAANVLAQLTSWWNGMAADIFHS